MKKQILITGATGLVGKKLIFALQKAGHNVSILSRTPKQIKNVQVFIWDVQNEQIDSNCMQGIDTIVHLAGENIGGKLWSKKQKQEIIDSRVKSTKLLHKAIKENGSTIKHFISASAVGYYGDCGDEILTENTENGFGFMAECCRLWEEAVDAGKIFGLRIVKVRIGVILAKKQGALASMDKPIRLFAGAPLGSGKQWIPWIHIQDIIAIFLKAVEDPAMIGPYNACAPFPVTNYAFTHAIAKAIHRPVWPINIPEKVIRLLLGEMADVVFISTNTSAERLLETDFKFKYTQLADALADIYKS